MDKRLHRRVEDYRLTCLLCVTACALLWSAVVAIVDGKTVWHWSHPSLVTKCGAVEPSFQGVLKYWAS